MAEQTPRVERLLLGGCGREEVWSRQCYCYGSTSSDADAGAREGKWYGNMEAESRERI